MVDGEGRAQLGRYVPQEGGEARVGGRGRDRRVQPGDETAALGGREGERDDLAGEQRGEEPAGAPVAGVWPCTGRLVHPYKISVELMPLVLQREAAKSRMKGIGNRENGAHGEGQSWWFRSETRTTPGI